MRNTGAAWRAGSVRRLEKGLRALPLAPYPWGSPSVRLDAGQLPLHRGARERCEGRRKGREVFSEKLKKGVDKWTQV